MGDDQITVLLRRVAKLEADKTALRERVAKLEAENTRLHDATLRLIWELAEAKKGRFHGHGVGSGGGGEAATSASGSGGGGEYRVPSELLTPDEIIEALVGPGEL